MCRGCCGQEACFAVTVAMDHPSREGSSPAEYDSIHVESVPYCQGHVKPAIQSQISKGDRKTSTGGCRLAVALISPS